MEISVSLWAYGMDKSFMDFCMGDNTLANKYSSVYV